MVASELFSFWYIKRIIVFFISRSVYLQRQPCRGVPTKNVSENMQPIYRRTPMPKCDFSNRNQLQSNLFKPYFKMSVLLQFCCIFSEHLFLRTTLDGCFSISSVFSVYKVLCEKAGSAQVLQISWTSVTHNRMKTSLGTEAWGSYKSYLNHVYCTT